LLYRFYNPIIAIGVIKHQVNFTTAEIKWFVRQRNQKLKIKMKNNNVKCKKFNPLNFGLF